MEETKDAPDDGKQPRLSETIRAIRAAGGSDWDKIDDVAGFLAPDDPDGAEIAHLRAEVERLRADRDRLEAAAIEQAELRGRAEGEARALIETRAETEAILRGFRSIVAEYRWFVGNTGWTCRDNPEWCSDLYMRSELLIAAADALAVRTAAGLDKDGGTPR